MLFRRYANPFPVLDAMILYDNLAAFFRHVLEEGEQDRLWELYLSQAVFIDQSFTDWKNGLFPVSGNGTESRVGQEDDGVATVKKAEQILSRFRPEG